MCEVFRRHLHNEYKIQLRGGKITEAAHDVIKALADDYKLLQLEDEVEQILKKEASKYLGSQHLIKLLEPVKIQTIDHINDDQGIIFFIWCVSLMQQVLF